MHWTALVRENAEVHLSSLSDWPLTGLLSSPDFQIYQQLTVGTLPSGELKKRKWCPDLMAAPFLEKGILLQMDHCSIHREVLEFWAKNAKPAGLLQNGSWFFSGEWWL